MSRYDLIGDIHGHANDLIELLELLGYSMIDGCYRHPNRQVIFLGDFVDRGCNQKKVLQIVMPMVQQKTALAVMGNHEFNALAYHTCHPDDNEKWLRPRNNKNTRQHLAFLQDYLGSADELTDVLEWFMQLPLWLELPGLRVVHACWDQSSIDVLKGVVGEGNTLTPELLVNASTEGSPFFEAIETILKGQELEIPNSGSFLDKDGNRRYHVRTRWWLNDVKTFADAALPAGVIAGQEAEHSLIDQSVWNGYKASEPPVFLGHYWFKGAPAKLADNVACVDYSVARNGKLVAYRFDGEEVLNNDKFVFVS